MEELSEEASSASPVLSSAGSCSFCSPAVSEVFSFPSPASLISALPSSGSASSLFSPVTVSSAVLSPVMLSLSAFSSVMVSSAMIPSVMVSSVSFPPSSCSSDSGGISVTSTVLSPSFRAPAPVCCIADVTAFPLFSSPPAPLVCCPASGTFSFPVSSS